MYSYLRESKTTGLNGTLPRLTPSGNTFGRITQENAAERDTARLINKAHRDETAVVQNGRFWVTHQLAEA